jgi:thiol:disulfide interchange protein DsbA
MFRRFLVPALFLVVLSACSKSEAPASADTAPAPEASSAPAAAEAPAAPAAEATTPAADASTPAADASAAPAPAPAPASATAVDPNAPEPRLGTDYEVIAVPQSTWMPADGRIEVAEVFSYMCVHCAEFQPQVDVYRPKLPADVRWTYVPAAFGGPWNEAAKAFFTADTMGVQERTHDAVFNAIFVGKQVTAGKPEEFVEMYGKLGVDKARFQATMSSFGITAKLNRAHQFALRTGVNATPTIIINGKYRVNITNDRGAKGMLDTVNFLIAKERTAKTAPASPAAPAATP